MGLTGLNNSKGGDRGCVVDRFSCLFSHILCISVIRFSDMKEFLIAGNNTWRIGCCTGKTKGIGKCYLSGNPVQRT